MFDPSGSTEDGGLPAVDASVPAAMDAGPDLGVTSAPPSKSGGCCTVAGGGGAAGDRAGWVLATLALLLTVRARRRPREQE
jgi:MYXO-CTERM domain-containing protein